MPQASYNETSHGSQRSKSPTRQNENRPYIGGQAVIEGVMMRSPRSFSVVVRRKSGELVVRERPMSHGQSAGVSPAGPSFGAWPRWSSRSSSARRHSDSRPRSTSAITKMSSARPRRKSQRGGS